MITISKYNKRKERAVINNYNIAEIEQAITDTAQYTAQKTAAQTVETVTMTATVNANGDLIMTSEVAAMAEATDGGELST